MSTSENDKNLTPLMKQYWEIKSLHRDKILLFRMGDFFEMFYDDAVTAAPILGIALTSRNKKSADETPMCGMPHHSVAGPINKLLASGHKVAICDQVEDPKTAKGIVKRAITRILTPGMVYDLDTLDGTSPHYLMCWQEGVASFADTSTGECFFIPVLDSEDLQKYLLLLPTAEVVSAEAVSELSWVKKISEKITVSHHDQILSVETYSELHKGCHEPPVSALRLLSYIKSLGSEETITALRPFVERNLSMRMKLGSTVIRHLEIFETYRGEQKGSLFHAINRTSTSAGARLLRQWLSFPLAEQAAIEARLNKIAVWRSHIPDLKQVRSVLSKMGDVERRLGKISQPQCNARDLLSLAQSIQAGVSALAIGPVAADLATEIAEGLLELAYDIERTIVEEPPLQVKQGYIIKEGVSPELDELIQLSTNGQDMLLKMEQKERERSGISSLKIRYNNVFGYYIEITNTHKDKVPTDYRRKQTLANAERYCTDELVELEKKILSSQTRRAELEYEFFVRLKNKILNQVADLNRLAQVCSELDVVTSLTWLAIEERYSRPQFSTARELKLFGNRHPVVEQFVQKDFVANNIDMKPNSCLLLTGPNMAGKSTLMRQVALTSVMAQMGSYVPADEALLPVFDAVYTRIGASDQLTEGLSTFMVEMTETSQMLAEASLKSLVILDEVGRGTSTFDGMCLAQAILEHLLTQVNALTFFATHYHELTQLEARFNQLRNAHMKVVERNGEIKFLYSLVSGPALKSYGVQVAKLAGLPTSITKRAQVLLQDLEAKKDMTTSQLSFLASSEVLNHEDQDEWNRESAVESSDLQIELQQKTEALELLNLKAEKLRQLTERIRDFKTESSTPMQALNKIAEWQSIIE